MEKEKSYRILSADGGGVHAASYIPILENLEKFLQCNIVRSQQFNMFIGTSTGAIVASALKFGLTASQIRDLYKNKSKKIFTPDWIFNHFFNKYGSYHLEHTLYEIFGNLTWEELATKHNPDVELIVILWNMSRSRLAFLSTDPKRAHEASGIFSVEDFRSFTEFIHSIQRESSPLDRYLKNSLEKELDTNKELTNHGEEALLEALNSILCKAFIYDEQRFQDIHLDEKTKNIIEENPKGDKLIYLNRSLLEVAYSKRIFVNMRKAKVADIITACCSGPFFFPPREFKIPNEGIKIYCDGGISSLNNPSAFGASLLPNETTNIHVLSLGSGEIERRYLEEQITTWTALESLLNTVDSLMSSSEDLMDRFFKHHADRIGISRYFRTNQKRAADSMLDDIYSMDKLASKYADKKIYGHKLKEESDNNCYEEIEKLNDQKLEEIWIEYFGFKSQKNGKIEPVEYSNKAKKIPLWIKATAWPEWFISVTVSFIVGLFIFGVATLRFLIGCFHPSSLKKLIAKQINALKGFVSSLFNSHRGLLYSSFYRCYMKSKHKNSVISFECRSTWVKRPDILFIIFLFLALLIGSLHFYPHYQKEISLAKIISGKKVSEKMIKKLVERTVYKESHYLIETKNRIKLNFCNYPYTPEESLDRFVADGTSDKKVKIAVAKHVNVSQKTLEKLALEEDVEIRCAVAGSFNASNELLTILSKDKSDKVKMIAKKQQSYRNLDDEAFQHLSKEKLQKGKIEVLYNGGEKGKHTGVIINNKGYVLIPYYQNYSKIMKKYEAVISNKKYLMKKINANETLGLAIFKIKGNFTPVEWANEMPRKNDKVIAVSVFDQKIRVGMIDNQDEKFLNITFNANNLMGYSPVLNSQGKMIGITYKGRIFSKHGHITRIHVIPTKKILEYIHRVLK